MESKLSERVLNEMLMHDGVEMTVGMCIQLARNTSSDTTLLPYLVSLMFHAVGSKNSELLRECQRLKTIHGGMPLSKPATSNGSDMPKVVDDKESFVDRVKAIITKAATKNNTEITSHARGRACTYLFNINSEQFCTAIERFAVDRPDLLKKYLGGTLYNKNVGVVAKFIGQVISMEIINNNLLQRVDIVFAFEDYYQNTTTVKNKLSDKQLTEDERTFFATFEGYLRTTQS